MEQKLANSFIEYVYLYDEKNKEWLWSEIPFFGEIKFNLKSLNESLSNMQYDDFEINI